MKKSKILIIQNMYTYNIYANIQIHTYIVYIWHLMRSNLTVANLSQETYSCGIDTWYAVTITWEYLRDMQCKVTLLAIKPSPFRALHLSFFAKQIKHPCTCEALRQVPQHDLRGRRLESSVHAGHVFQLTWSPFSGLSIVMPVFNQVEF